MQKYLKYLLKFSLCGLAYQLLLSDRQLVSLSRSVGLGLFMDEIVSILGDHANSSREDQQAIVEHYLESQIPNTTKALIVSVLDDKVCLDVQDKLKLYGLTDLPSLVNDLDFAETFEMFMAILSTFRISLACPSITILPPFFDTPSAESVLKSVDN